MNTFCNRAALFMALLLAVLAVALTGCGGGGASGGSSGSGTLAIRMADAPDPTITAVNILVDRVDAHIDGNWVTISDNDLDVDLMTLIFTDMLLAQKVVLAGRYTQVRLVVSSATVTDAQGTHPLVIPSGLRTGIKVNLNYDVNANTLTEILLDFNVQRSIRKLGNGVYHLQPVIPAVIKATAGTITGTVTNGATPLHNATIKAIYTSGSNYSIGTLVNETSSVTDGRFKIWALKEGVYSLDVTWTDPNLPNVRWAGMITNVQVTASQNTEVGTIALIQLP